MSDRADPGSIWRDQAGGESACGSWSRFVNRRTGALFSSTRSEILMSICAALLLLECGGKARYWS